MPVSPRLLELLRCPTCRAPLAVTGDALSCASEGKVFPVEGGVVFFCEERDRFYEGAYVRQVHHLPGRSRMRDAVYFGLVQSGILGEIRRVLPPGGTVVDLGCAGGIRWLGRDAETIGIDLSVASLRAAAEIYAGALQARVEALPLADGCVDVVYGSYVFEHLDPGTKDRSLAEMRRVLRPGGAGVLQFDTLSDNRLIRWARRDPEAFHRGFVENDGHIGLEPLSAAKQRIERGGFRLIRSRRFGTTALQYAATYQWLAKAYGATHPWTRVLSRAAERISSSPAGLPVDFALTLFDRALEPIARDDDATRAILVFRKE